MLKQHIILPDHYDVVTRHDVIFDEQVLQLQNDHDEIIDNNLIVLEADVLRKITSFLEPACCSLQLLIKSELDVTGQILESQIPCYALIDAVICKGV